MVRKMRKRNVKKQNYKKRNKKKTRRLRKTMKRNKKGGEYSNLAKKTMKKNASRYPKRFHATFERTDPSKLLRKRTPKVYPRKGPGFGGRRKTRKKRRRS